MNKYILVESPLSITIYPKNDMFINDSKNLMQQTVYFSGLHRNDTVMIAETKQTQEELTIKSNVLVSDEEKQKIQEVVNLFFEYTNILTKNNIIIEINRNIKNLNITKYYFDSLLASILVGLNDYYKTELDLKELKLIGYKVSLMVAYYIVGGFRRINESGIEKLDTMQNPYQNYVLINPRNANISETSDALTLTEEARIKIFLRKYPDLVYALNGNAPLYYITSKNPHALDKVPYILKKEFPSWEICSCKNTSKHKKILNYAVYAS